MNFRLKQHLSNYFTWKWPFASVLAAITLFAGLYSPSAARDRERVMFTAVVGPDKVLLRWAGTKKLSGFSGFNIHRREDGSPAFITVNSHPIQPLTDASQIRTIFETTGEDLILADIQSILGSDYPAEILSLRTSGNGEGIMKLALLVNSNYGVSISEGLGYLDRAVTSGNQYTYELWGVDGTGAEIERLGKVTVTAGDKTELPAPQELEHVPVAGPTGDRKVYLRWEGVPARDPDGEANIGFGYDIYRMEGTSSAVIDDDDVSSNPNISKVNTLPVIIFPAQNVDRGKSLFISHCFSCHSDRNDPNILGKGIREFRASTNASAITAHGTLPSDLDLLSIFNYVNDFFFMDEESISGGPLLVYGTTYTYWVVARDLLRQHGIFSSPVQAVARDTIPPKVPYNVQAAVTGAVPDQKIRIFWDRNRSELNPFNEPGKYVDDTVRYKVYRRFGDIRAPKVFWAEVVQPADPDVSTVEYIDTSINEDDWGKIYWYHITAVDAAGNESPHSAPAKGLVYDLVPPDVPVCTAFCENPSNLQQFAVCGNFVKDNITGILTIVVNPHFPPFMCQRPSGSDVEGIRIYRSIDGTDFHYLKDVHFPVGVDAVEVTDDEYRPRLTQQVYYRFRAFDENTNLSGVSARSSRMLIYGDPPPSPIIAGAKIITEDPVENLSLVEIYITAINTDGIAGFRLYQDRFLNDAIEPVSVSVTPYPEVSWGEAVAGGTFETASIPVEDRIPLSDIPGSLGNISYDAVERQYALRAWVLTPAPGNYYAVTALDFGGLESDKLFYYWTGEVLADRELQWPLRPGAEVKTLRLRTPVDGIQEICMDWDEPDEYGRPLVDVSLNYAVFRVRGEDPVPDRFIQVSPLFLGNFFNEPKREIEPEYCDTDIIYGQKYSYVVLGIGGDGEIKKSYGPASVYAPDALP